MVRETKGAKVDLRKTLESLYPAPFAISEGKLSNH